ncbi:DUF2268 domain-containing putative Zn-dependent protease [Cytobacillus kochii]|nr:DUF2268 domain-containing putative Zn-dependent protease [Cytobacillus kochii]
MPVIRTDEWLNQHFTDPEKLIEPLLDSFHENEPQRLYQFLSSFGMYSPNRRNKEQFKQLKENRTWEKVELLLNKYRKNWKGPDVPIYLFPIAQGGLFFRTSYVKSGLSFPDKMFLFLAQLEDEKELEALFVHEYHHICRMKRLKKEMAEYTLLDSIVLEGLAEWAVEKSCGKSYRSKWCTEHDRERIRYYWHKYVKNNIDIKRDNELHDQILFGEGKYPKMLGYSIGYEIVSMYDNEKKIKLKESMVIPSKLFLPQWEKE